jgi:hypothetical protein
MLILIPLIYISNMGFSAPLQIIQFSEYRRVWMEYVILGLLILSEAPNSQCQDSTLVFDRYLAIESHRKESKRSWNMKIEYVSLA